MAKLKQQEELYPESKSTRKKKGKQDVDVDIIIKLLRIIKKIIRQQRRQLMTFRKNQIKHFFNQKIEINIYTSSGLYAD